VLDVAIEPVCHILHNDFFGQIIWRQFEPIGLINKERDEMVIHRHQIRLFIHSENIAPLNFVSLSHIHRVMKLE
jgi:hypothetical protein